MCVNDWRLGRLIRSVGRSFNTVTSSNVTYPASKQRVGITFNILDSFTLPTGDWKVTFTNGTVLSGMAYIPYFHLTLQTHGDLVTHGFTIAKISEDIAGTVTEYFLPEEYLAASLEKFKSDYGIGR